MGTNEPNCWSFETHVNRQKLFIRHEKRIMHRDLKPANIFIASDGSLKVGDLGLGRVFSSETIEAYSKVGTPFYSVKKHFFGLFFIVHESGPSSERGI